MVTFFYKAEGVLKREKEFSEFSGIPREDVVWADLNYANKEEKDYVEDLFDIRLQSRKEAEEIESSSRYFETEDEIITNSSFLIYKDGHYRNEPVSFVLKNDVLISYRNADLRSFQEMHRKLRAKVMSGHQIFLSLFESRIDFDADLLEAIARDISVLSKSIAVEQDLDKELILKITKFQEATMLLRESIIDKQRTFSAILRSEDFPKDQSEKIQIMIQDITSLLNHAAFSFERLEYLQNTFLGLVDIEQNKIIKIFTVVAAAFMPPTLIASMYGMNFQFMPELSWKGGYPFAIGFMVLSSVITLLYFKWKQWL